MGAFVGVCILAGCALVAWAIFFVGRRIARVLWGLLCAVENDKEQKEILERQRDHLFP